MHSRTRKSDSEHPRHVLCRRRRRRASSRCTWDFRIISVEIVHFPVNFEERPGAGICLFILRGSGFVACQSARGGGGGPEAVLSALLPTRALLPVEGPQHTTSWLRGILVVKRFERLWADMEIGPGTACCGKGLGTAGPFITGVANMRIH